MDSKSLIQSKTFWVATIQALMGVIAIYTGAFPAADWVGTAIVGKSILDIVLRIMTTTEVTL